MTIRGSNICRPDDPDASMLPGPGAPGKEYHLSVCQGNIFIFLLLPTATFGLIMREGYKKICRDS